MRWLLEVLNYANVDMISLHDTFKALKLILSPSRLKTSVTTIANFISSSTALNFDAQLYDTCTSDYNYSKFVDVVWYIQIFRSYDIFCLK